MKNINSYILITLFCLLALPAVAAQTVSQKLAVERNDQKPGGELHISYQIKGTGLGQSNTIGSLTADVLYDTTKIRYLSDTSWAYGPAQGYQRFASRSPFASIVRIGTLGFLVKPADGFTGFDVPSSYTKVVILRFRIIDVSAGPSLTIDPLTNQVGLFETHANSGSGGVIKNVLLSPVIDIEPEPLPVELSSFSAYANNSFIYVSWTTAGEINSYGFEIERAPMRSGNKRWVKTGFVPAAGNVSSSRSYSFTDHPETAGLYLYRLKQIDRNGSYKYSNEVTVNFSPSYKLSLEQNYPNPFNPATVITFSLEKAGYATLIIYNMIGERVAVIADQTFEPGKYSFTFNAEGLESGIYFYELKAPDVRIIKKMILLR